EHLRAATGAVPYSQVAEVIERELGRPPRQAYAWLEERPLASASIGQAHRGRLHDGTEVIVKVRKPGVREDVLADLELMRSLAARACRSTAAARSLPAPRCSRRSASRGCGSTTPPLSTRPGSTAPPWPSGPPRRWCGWCWWTASSMPTRIRATCSSTTPESSP